MVDRVGNNLLLLEALSRWSGQVLLVLGIRGSCKGWEVGTLKHGDRRDDHISVLQTSL